LVATIKPSKAYTTALLTNFEASDLLSRIARRLTDKLQSPSSTWENAMKHISPVAALVGASLSWPCIANAEIFAMLNYESKPAEALKAYKSPVPGQTRQEGIAIIDVNPASANYGKTVETITLPSDLVAHHIFYNRDSSKVYVTALGKSELRVIDMSKRPFAAKVIVVPECQVGEDVVFSQDNKTWYLTCMGSAKLIIGDAVADEPIKTVSLPRPYPHGVAVHNGIDRLLVTETVRATDLKDAGENITVIEASTGKVLATHKVSNKPSPSGEAPVEILFVPGSNPPVAYITNMYGGTLWTATWKPQTKDFDVAQVFDFATVKAGVPLEMYFNQKVDRLYVTTAKPGHLQVFDISKGVGKPELLKSIPAAEGAHHVAFTKDERFAYVQNSLLNLPGMSDGSVTVIDLVKAEAVDSMNVLKDSGFNPNCIVLLPEWNNPAGH
jgi:DNA-binding beta-propeller fold protein YncE